jgi:lipopolysaccharide biosynthesis regulator YciM
VGIWGKLGAAALKAGNHQVAVEAYARLGAEEPTRVAEAARGLERVARAAVRGDSGSAILTAAVVALRKLAPERPLGRLARSAEAPGTADRMEELNLMPAAIAAANSSGDVNRMLLRYGAALRATTACEQAVAVYRMTIRRSPGLEARRQAGEGLGACALQLGLDALAAERFAFAEEWFVEVTQVDPASPVGLRARIGWGDTRLAQGDVLGAAIVWQTVLSASRAPDSLRRMARDRITQLGSAGPAIGRDSSP